jgi:hypothetical protein
MKKLIVFLIAIISSCSFLQAQNCLTCNNGTNGNKGKVSMFKSNYPDPGYQYACVPKSKWKEYNLNGWFVCYDGIGLASARAVPISNSSNNPKNNSDSSGVTKTYSINTATTKCNCNCSLPNYGLDKGQLKNCLSYCYRLCEFGW